MSSLGESLDPRRNSVNALRLAFAFVVLVVHCFPLSGYSEDMPRLVFDDTVGTYALSGFFVISGYLITASRLSSPSFWRYLWRRCLRLWPAWICSLTLVALVLGPISVWMAGGGSYSWSSGISYIYNNLLLVLRQLGIEGTLADVPVVGVWNFSAWTLFFEFSLWIGLGLMVTIFPRKLLKHAAWLGFAVFTAIKVYDRLVSGSAAGIGAREPGAQEQLGAVLALAEPLARLGIFFMAGALCYLYRDRILLSSRRVWLCAGVSFVLAVAGWFHVLAALPFAYLILWASSSTRFSRVNYPDDYSYGIYIYAFPITQMVAVFSLHVAHVPLPAYILVVAAVTAPLAWLSWHFVERPCLALKDFGRRTRRATAPSAPA